ncbi:YhgE/Pip family protein [Virgibacillus sp. W0181]|uniref:YhgE/Pip family protein n=1 Tax=Virgibacillus sp. W0181 TaxID=3391581 RepID=UPI003F453C4C
MKNIWGIYSSDAKNIATNWVAAILIGGLILLPSLYAWLNIKASWDPYGQTDQIPIGIVNEDEGAMVRDQELQVGDELVATLKKNKDMDWHFVSRDEAMDKVEYGDYFAAIVIPKNFSKNLSSVIEGSPQKANVDYYVNEKINAIAPKITEKGASYIVDQISSEFIATVNGVIFDLFNKIGIEMEKDLPDIKQFEEYVFTLEDNLPEINQLLHDAMSDATNGENIIHKARGLLPEAKRTTSKGLQIIDETTSFLNTAEERLTEIAPKITKDLEKVQKITTEIDEFMKEVQNSHLNLQEGLPLIKKTNEKVESATDTINQIEQTLQQIKAQQTEENSNSEKIDEALKNIARLKAEMNLVKKKNAEIDQFINTKSEEAEQVFSDLKEKAADTSVQVDQFVKKYKEEIHPFVLKEITNTKETLHSAKGILNTIEDTFPEVEQLLSRTENNLTEGKQTLANVVGELPYVNNKVNELANRIRNLQAETDINEIIELLKNDPEQEKGFFAEPVTLSETKIFSIPNYGTGMTPFYTVLSLWVGALLLISLLSTEVNREVFTGKQVYFGRYLTFATIGLLQTLIVTLGDHFLVGVDVSSLFWFVTFGLFISMVFMAIVYTLVSVFGDVGKAMAIILLVLQIAGSGGTYPVVLLPEFFQTISPFLPFTYAVDLMREAVGGIVWKRALHDLAILGIFGVSAIVIGLFLKDPINKQTQKLMQKSKETGLFH